MKAMALLPAMAAVILALGIAPASSQQACIKEFQACMDGCSSKAKGMQGACFQGCEGKNTMCGEKVYGKRPLNGAPSAASASAAAEPKDAPKEALAKNEKPMDARDQAPKPAAQQQQQPKGMMPARR